MQNDDLSLPARALVPLLRDLSLPSGPAAQGARAAARLGLRARQGLGRGRHLRDVAAAAVREHAAAAHPASAARQQAESDLASKRLIDSLHAPDGRFGEHPTTARDALLALSLDEAVAELTKRFGPDSQNWKVRAGAVPSRADPRIR